nr:hypothetical protein BaRGS_025516 [Batillaria attramentaria]
MIQGVEGLPAEDLAVFYRGRPLEGGMSLTAFEDSATLEVEVRLFGGKVHGPRARVGKVRRQTSKVEPQEKKNRKTGDAKRGM